MKSIQYKSLVYSLIAVTCLFSFNAQLTAQTTPAPLKRFLQKPALQGASVSFMAKDVKTGEALYSYESDLQLTPASVMKTVTTATALELLGEDFHFETSILYDGDIQNGVLNGNLYIYGSGDPTLNSSELKSSKDSILDLWTSAIKKAGIHEITGAVIADESIFDTEGVSMKWMREDLGSYYGQGSYGLNIFDNQYALYLESDAAGTKPTIDYTEPSMPFLTFYNYLTALPASTDSCFITGFPFSNERYLYGTIPTRKSHFKLIGDIPEPALYLAHYFNDYIENRGIRTQKEPSCYRILSQAGKWNNGERKQLITTYSPPLKEITRILCFVSHNLYADALIKTLGLRYQSSSLETISSFEKGVRVVKNHWKQKGLNTASLWMFDGSGLAITDKVTTDFLCDLYSYMAIHSNSSQTFINSLPRAGMEGTLRNMLKGSSLQGKAHLKSGSMSRVLCYGGYIYKGDKQYAIAILVNNFTGKNSQLRASIEELFLTLF